MRRARVIDYAIYIAAGLVLSAAMFVPILYGVDMDVYLPRITIAGSAIFVAGFVAYDLRNSYRNLSYWIFIASVLLLHLTGAYFFYRHGYRMNTLTWVLISTVEIASFKGLFRGLLRHS